jgi:hypothetical protein
MPYYYFFMKDALLLFFALLMNDAFVTPRRLQNQLKIFKDNRDNRSLADIKSKSKASVNL